MKYSVIIGCPPKKSQNIPKITLIFIPTRKKKKKIPKTTLIFNTDLMEHSTSEQAMIPSIYPWYRQISCIYRFIYRVVISHIARPIGTRHIILSHVSPWGCQKTLCG